jgi:hypothetical protein
LGDGVLLAAPFELVAAEVPSLTREVITAVDA